MNLFKRKTRTTGTAMVPFNEPVADFQFNIDIKTTPVKPKQRAYNSAQKISYLQNWVSAPTKPNQDIKNGLLSLRARSREAVQNNSFVRRFLALCKSNIIGDQGFQFQSKIAFPDGKPDDAARKTIETAWKDWGQYGSPDVTGTKTLLQMCNDFIQQIFMDGEYLAIEVYNNNNPYGYQLQVIDPMQLDVLYSENLTGGRYIRESIEYDRHGKPLYYHILTDDNADYYNARTGKHYQKIKANRVYHCFLADFVNQRRGVPIFACSLLRLGMLDGYTEAELVAARLGATTMGVWYDNVDGVGYDGDQKTDDGDYVAAASPGEFIKAPNGTRLDVFDPNHPNSGYSQFTSDLLREIASGLNVSYASLSNNYSDANYSSLRQAAIVEQDMWRTFQRWAIDHFIERLFKSWASHSLATGAITINGRRPSFDENYYMPHSWQPKRWQWVDPQKEMNAHTKAIDYCISSPQEIIRQKGRDPDEVLDEIRNWQEQLNTMGIKTGRDYEKEPEQQEPDTED